MLLAARARVVTTAQAWAKGMPCGGRLSIGAGPAVEGLDLSNEPSAGLLRITAELMVLARSDLEVRVDCRRIDGIAGTTALRRSSFRRRKGK
jgi:hypothetical protein